MPGKLSEPRRQWVSLGNLILDGEWEGRKNMDGEELTSVSEVKVDVSSDDLEKSTAWYVYFPTSKG